MKGVATARSAALREVCSVVMHAVFRGGARGCRAGHTSAKAMEGISVPGAGAEEPSGVWGVERVEGGPGNWREPPRRRACGAASASVYNRTHGK